MVPTYRAPFGAVFTCAWLAAMASVHPAAAQPEEPAAADDAAADDATDDDATTDDATDDDAAEDGVNDAEPAAASGGELADDPFGEEEPASDDGEAAAGAEAAASGAKATTTATTDPTAAAPDATGVRFEPLRAEAFPRYKSPGIPSGSLQLDMHGMQWPYLPAEPGGPATRIGFSGSVWVDNSFQKVDAGAEGDLDIEQWIQQARLVLRFSPTYSWKSGWFVQAQGEPVLNNDQTQTQPLVVDADDLYLKVGIWNLLDWQVGRFQGWEVYHLGLGLDLNTFERRGAETDNNLAVDLYGLTAAWDRPSGVGNVAFHLYPIEFFRLELLAQLGSSSGLNTLATRPVAILDFGFLKLKGGVEYLKLSARQEGIPEEWKVKGAGGSLQLVFDPWVELGGGVASSQTDHTDRNGGYDALGSNTTTTYGGFANVRIIEDLVVGGGVHWTESFNLQLNPRTGTGEERNHLQAFGAIQYRLFKKLYAKAVVAQGRSEYLLSATPAFENQALSGRLRLMYLF